MSRETKYLPTPVPFTHKLAATPPVASAPPSDLVRDVAKAAAFTRQHSIASIYHAGSGHPGGAMSCADVLACLYGA